MNKIDINVQKISALTAKFTSLANSTDVVEQTVRGLKASVPQKVQARRNISARISQIANELRETEAGIRKLSDFTQFAAEEYTQAEKNVRNSVERAANNGLIPRAPGKGKKDGNLFFAELEKYIGNIKGFLNDPNAKAEWLNDVADLYSKWSYIPGLMTGMVGISKKLINMRIFYKLGYNVVDGKIVIQNIPKSKLTSNILNFVDKAAGKIDNHKLSGVIKYSLLNPLTAHKHSGKGIVKLLPKITTGLFMEDINKFHGALDGFTKDFKYSESKLMAVKNNAKSIFDGSKAFLRSNFLTGLVVEGIEGTVISGLKITANNLTWADDTAKRHYENTKVIRQEGLEVLGAAGGAATGAALGASIGAIAGPVGIVVGGALGGMVGSVTGTLAAKKVNKLLDKLSDKFIDPHRDKESNTVNKVKQASKNIFENAKGVFFKPIFG